MIFPVSNSHEFLRPAAIFGVSAGNDGGNFRPMASTPYDLRAVSQATAIASLTCAPADQQIPSKRGRQASTLRRYFAPKSCLRIACKLMPIVDAILILLSTAPVSAETGKLDYQKYCGLCHGIDGKGVRQVHFKYSLIAVCPDAPTY